MFSPSILTEQAFDTEYLHATKKLSARLPNTPQDLTTQRNEIENVKRLNHESVIQFDVISEENKAMKGENLSLKQDLERLGTWSLECASKVAALQASAISVAQIRDELVIANDHIKELESILIINKRALEDQDSWNNERDECLQRLQDAEDDYSQLKEQHRLQQIVMTRIQKALKEKGELAEELARKNAETAQLREDADALREKLAFLQSSTFDLSQHSSMMLQKDQHLAQAQAALEQAEARHAELSALLDRCVADVAQLTQQKATLRDAADRLRADAAGLRAQLDEHAEDVEHLRTLLAEKQAETTHLARAVESLKRQRDESREQALHVGSGGGPHGADDALHCLEDDPYALQNRDVRVALDAAPAELAQAQAAAVRLRALQTVVSHEKGVQTS
jgi:DNA repair exonuclease SbcCD ATPase subunit